MTKKTIMIMILKLLYKSIKRSVFNNMRCPYCNKHEITSHMCVPNITMRDKGLPVFTYEFTCPNCKRKTILSKKQFEELDK